MLEERVNRFGECRDALQIWQRLGVPDPARVADLEAGELRALKRDRPEA
jgi:malonate decarboxylase beta subunit